MNAREFLLPTLGQGPDTVEIVEWHVRVDQAVIEGQVLVSLDVDDEVIDIAAPCDGEIGLLCGEAGDWVTVGERLLIFSSVDSDQTHLELRVIDSSAPGDSAAPLVAHPDAHDLAKALRLELESIDAKADDGIVTIEDVKRAIQVEPAPDREEGQPLHGSRKAMAEQLGLSASEPVVTTLAMDITLPSGRSDAAPILALLRAIADACLAYPALNAHYDSARNLRCLNPHINIGFTIDIDGGLVIPVLKKVEQQDPASLSLTLNTLQQQVHDGQLDPGIFHGATITLTVASVPDIKFASVPVMAPQVAGIGVGRPRQAVVIEQDTLVIAVVLPVTLSFDRRVVSSEEASRFLLAIAQTLSSEA